MSQPAKTMHIFGTTLPNEIWKEIIGSISLHLKIDPRSYSATLNSTSVFESYQETKYIPSLCLVNKFFNYWVKSLLLRHISFDHIAKINRSDLSKMIYLNSIGTDESTRKSPKTALEKIYINDALLVLTNIRSLYLSNDRFITDDTIPRLTQLTLLNLNNNRRIINISSLTNLTSLDLSFSMVGGTSLIKLTNLTHLDLSVESCIYDESLEVLTQLKTLVLGENVDITDNSIKFLTNLTQLNINNTKITGKSIKYLTNLTHLEMGQTLGTIKDEDLGDLTRLTYLDLSWNENITNKTLYRLTNIRSLVLARNSNITSSSVKSLPNLTMLNISNNDTIHTRTVKKLTNLVTLYTNSPKTRALLTKQLPHLKILT